MDHGAESSKPAITDSLAQRIGDRIRSRLFEMCKDIEMDGKDFRAEIKQANHRF
jgi:DNA replication protein DnaC